MNPRLGAEILIRRMAASDLDRVIELARSLKDAPHWPRSAYCATLGPMAAPLRIALVAEALETGTVVGFAVTSLLPPQADLETIAVAAEWQRRGAARQIFKAVANELKAAQVSEVLLEVRASNYPAFALYTALGFIETGRRSHYYVDPVDDAVLLELRLL